MDLVFDIETAPAYEKLSDAPKEFRAAYHYHWAKNPEGLALEAHFETKAALTPEFGKVVCISAIKKGDTSVTSYYGDEEASLRSFIKYAKGCHLIGHYIKGFDLPFIQTRLAYFGIPLPGWLRFYGVKPWEISHITCTKEAWKQSVMAKGKASSLAVVCMVLGVPTPKDGITGKDVGKAFYDGRIEEIVEYCEKDVIANAQVYNKLKELNFI